MLKGLRIWVSGFRVLNAVVEESRISAFGVVHVVVEVYRNYNDAQRSLYLECLQRISFRSRVACRIVHVR